MARLVVYVRSSFCPDVWRWQRWVSQHELDFFELDIDADPQAYARVIEWTGHESVPTLVIAPDDGLEPIEEPSPRPGRSPRGVDRGTMLTEPNPGQVEAFLDRWGIRYGRGAEEGEPAGEDRRWWQRR
jgi:glutaredoxin